MRGKELFTLGTVAAVQCVPLSEDGKTRRNRLSGTERPASHRPSPVNWRRSPGSGVPSDRELQEKSSASQVFAAIGGTIPSRTRSRQKRMWIVGVDYHVVRGAGRCIRRSSPDNASRYSAVGRSPQSLVGRLVSAKCFGSVEAAGAGDRGEQMQGFSGSIASLVKATRSKFAGAKLGPVSPQIDRLEIP